MHAGIGKDKYLSLYNAALIPGMPGLWIPDNVGLLIFGIFGKDSLCDNTGVNKL